METAVEILKTVVPLGLMAWVARGQHRDDKSDDKVADLTTRVSKLEEHRQFLEAMMARIEARFDKLETKLERREP